MDDTLLGIGQMAKASGLPVSALRFYAGSSILVPATVVPVTGYRLYRPAQLREARLIAQLRRVEMPLRDIRAILGARADLASVAEIIEQHLHRLEAGLADVAPNHVITAEVADYPREFTPYADALRHRSMLCRRLAMVPIECVVRGYLTGSALADYQRTGAVHGSTLPAGLTAGSRLPEPIFTPTTKAPLGEHDALMTYDDVVRTAGADRAEHLRALSLEIYRRGAEQAATSGIILADSKVEFGVTGDGTLMLADEVLTPDSARYWPADDWQPGRAQQSYDKQYVRDWLTGASGWDRTSPHRRCRPLSSSRLEPDTSEPSYGSPAATCCRSSSISGPGVARR